MNGAEDMRDQPGSVSPMLQDRRIDRTTTIWIVLALLAFLIVDVQTRIYEFQRNGAVVPMDRILLHEVTGIGAYLALVWFIGRLAAWMPPGQSRWDRFLLFHFAGSVGTALAVIGIFVGIRKVLSPVLLGESYVFDADPLGGFLYEYRKFALFYVACVTLFALRRQLAYRSEELEAARADASRSHRITLKDGSRTIRVEEGGVQLCRHRRRRPDDSRARNAAGTGRTAHGGGRAGDARASFLCRERPAHRRLPSRRGGGTVDHDDG